MELYAEQLEEFLHRYEREKKEEGFLITRFSDGDGIVAGYTAQFDEKFRLDGRAGNDSYGVSESEKGILIKRI